MGLVCAHLISTTAGASKVICRERLTGRLLSRTKRDTTCFSFACDADEEERVLSDDTSCRRDLARSKKKMKCRDLWMHKTAIASMHGDGRSSRITPPTDKSLVVRTYAHGHDGRHDLCTDPSPGCHLVTAQP